MNSLKTTRLTLEPQVAAHAEEMFRVLSDPAIYEHENEPPQSVEWLTERFRKLESRRSPDGRQQWLNWVLRVSSSGELIGYVQATVLADTTAAIAYELGSQYWGQGFATEAVQAMIDELVVHHRVQGLAAVLKKTNTRSFRLLERLGFSEASRPALEEAKVEADELLMLGNPGAGPLLKKVDHLVYATPDLETSVAELEERLGVRAAPGGRHQGRGTRNALMALSPWSYLEIIGPDPAQPATDSPRWFGIDGRTRPRLVTWAAKGTALENLVAAAGRRGISPGPVIPGRRERADGVVLRWQCTDPLTVIADGLVPFFIDWGESPHPASSSPGGARLVALRAVHPEPMRVRQALSAVGLDLIVERGPRPALVAHIRTGTGLSELR